MGKLTPPDEWTDEERQKVRRAIAEHRLSRVDLYYWQQVDIVGRNPFELARESMVTTADIERRVAAARERLEATFERPSQEAYLGRWVSS